MAENSWYRVTTLWKHLVKEIFCLCYTTNVLLLPFIFLSGGTEQASNDGMEEGNHLYTIFTVCLLFLPLPPQTEINILWRHWNAKIFVVHLNGSSDWWICYINTSVGQICLANPQLCCSNTHFLPVFLGSHVKKIYGLFHYVGTAVNLQYFSRPCNKNSERENLVSSQHFSW